MTRDDMFSMLKDRLDDVEDALLDDASPLSGWAIISVETTMRQQIARELERIARCAYTINQEAVTADHKETDIRLVSTGGSHQQAVIELKIGEKDRSASELRQALREQLVDKYMASSSSRCGCLLITSQGRTWTHPDTGEKLNSQGLVDFLTAEANRIEEASAGELRLLVRVLDLSPRLSVETKTRRPSSGAPRKMRRA